MKNFITTVVFIVALFSASFAFAFEPSTSNVPPSNKKLGNAQTIMAFQNINSVAVSPAELNQVSGDGWNAIYQLVKLNIKIWGNVGWQYGRYESLKKYGVDIGPYPGAKNVTESWFKKKFR